MMLSKLIFKGRAFVVTAAHNLQFLPPGWQKPDVHTGWFFHPFRDIAAALLKNGSEVQDTCAATDLTFEVGERVSTPVQGVGLSSQTSSLSSSSK
eukprot:6491876-Amphidinium_carterae.1